MPTLIPYGLRKIWSPPANRSPGGLRALARCLGRSAAWASYQTQKQLGVFPSQGGGWSRGSMACGCSC